MIQMFMMSNAMQTVIGLMVIALLFVWAGGLEYRKCRQAKTAVADLPAAKSSSPTTPADARILPL